MAVLARAAKSDDELPEPPHLSGHYDDWTVIEPDGNTVEIGTPVIEFDSGSIEWR